MTLLKLTKFAAVAALLAIASACNPSSITTALNSVVVSADAALAVLGASGTLPAPTVALATNYLTAVSQAANRTATELASADTDAAKSSQIAQIWAEAAIPNLTGVPQNVSVALLAVDAAAKAFVSSLPKPAPGLQARASVKAHVTKPTMTDRRALRGVSDRAKDVADRCAALGHSYSNPPPVL